MWEDVKESFIFYIFLIDFLENFKILIVNVIDFLILNRLYF